MADPVEFDEEAWLRFLDRLLWPESSETGSVGVRSREEPEALKAHTTEFKRVRHQQLKEDGRG